MKEEWRDIDGYEGLYQVSNLGRVKSLKYMHQNVERVLKPFVAGTGYLQVTLCKNQKHEKRFVHRLVANAFLPNSSSLPQVNHKDECKTNNAVNNLEWCTHLYNHRYGTIKARILEHSHKKAVNQYMLNGTLVKTWSSASEAGRNGFSRTDIQHCCKGRIKKHRGFIWRYA